MERDKIDFLKNSFLFINVPEQTVFQLCEPIDAEISVYKKNSYVFLPSESFEAL